MTRCKVGDIAIVVAGEPAQNIGKVVRVIGLHRRSILWGTLWEYEGAVVGPLGVRAESIADDCLRPIQNPGDDVADPRDVLIPEPLREHA